MGAQRRLQSHLQVPKTLFPLSSPVKTVFVSFPTAIFFRTSFSDKRSRPNQSVFRGSALQWTFLNFPYLENLHGRGIRRKLFLRIPRNVQAKFALRTAAGFRAGARGGEGGGKAHCTHVEVVQLTSKFSCVHWHIGRVGHWNVQKKKKKVLKTTADRLHELFSSPTMLFKHGVLMLYLLHLLCGRCIPAHIACT